MKHVNLMLVLVLLSLIPAATAFAADQNHATGGVVAQASPTITVQTSFTAHGTDDPVKGQVEYKNSLGEFFHGEVNICYVQFGNIAVFSGTMREGFEGTFAGPYFKIQVIDNGEGGDAPPDLIAVVATAVPPPCVFDGQFLNPVIHGDLQVHQMTA